MVQSFRSRLLEKILEIGGLAVTMSTSHDLVNPPVAKTLGAWASKGSRAGAEGALADALGR